MKKLIGTGGVAITFFLLIALLSSVWAEAAKRSTFEVRNLSCGSCLALINGALEELDGFEGMSADLWDKKVFVEHAADLQAEEIAKVITDIGYPAEVVAVENSNPEDKPAADDRSFTQSGGCSGCGPTGCGAAASSWQAFYQKYFGNRNK